MQYYFAPLESITTTVYRRLHGKHFGGVDSYYMPFVSPTQQHCFTPRQCKEILPEYNSEVYAVPQILCKESDDFIWSVEELANMGYSEVNLNLGCPSKTVTTKGKGSGFLTRLEDLDRFLTQSYDAFEKLNVDVTIKTRLGKSDPEEFYQILELYNKFPIPKLIIHPRVQLDFYRNHVRTEMFEHAVKTAKMPLCYNGDVVTLRDYKKFTKQFKTTNSLMIGRGAIADPALFRKCQGGKGATKAELLNFVTEMFDEYTKLYQSENNALIRMREIWVYMVCLFDDSDEIAQKFRRMKTPTEYKILLNEIFKHYELRENATTGFHR